MKLLVSTQYQIIDTRFSVPFCSSAEIVMKCYEFAPGKVGCEKEKPKTLSRQNKINLILMLLTALVSTSPVVKVIKERAYLSNGIPALGLEPIQRPQTSFR